MCACPVDSPVRGGPAYRRLLACARVRVCVAHLTPGVHLLDGKRVRYCTNHHTLHPADEFEAGTASARATSQTTCVRARTMSLARIKRQRGAQQQAGQASHQPAPPFSPSSEPQQQLLVSRPLPVDWEEEDVEGALFGWPFSNGGGFSGGLDDSGEHPFSFFLPPKQQPRLALTRQPGRLLLEQEHRGDRQGCGEQQQLQSAVAPVHVLHSPLAAAAAGNELQAAADQQHQQQLALPPVLHSPLVGAAIAQLHSLATSTQTAAFLRCFAGDQARSHVEECPAAVQQYIWVRKIFAATIMQRHTRMVTALHDRLRSLVVQARQDSVPARGCDAASELGAVLDVVHAMGTRRAALLASLAKRTGLLSPSIVLMMQEFQDGNEVHLRNADTLRQLVQRARAEGIPREARAEVIRLVAEFSVVQLGLVRDALAERAAWLDGLSPSGGQGKFDIRRGLDGLWQSVQHSWVATVIHEDSFAGRGRPS